MSGIFSQRAETLTSFTLWWLGTTTTSGPERALRRVSLPEARSYQPNSSTAALVPSSPAFKIKTAVLVYKSLYGVAPLWTLRSCQPSPARRQLRSSDIARFLYSTHLHCVVRGIQKPSNVRLNYTRLGNRAFPVAGPRLWISLPTNLRQSDLTLQQFRRALKTYSFGWLRLQQIVTFV